MTEHSAENGTDRLAAHERLSTGALASWMRACASHPWRVVLSWLGILALLIVLVGTVGGSLKDEFEILDRTPSGRPTSSKPSSQRNRAAS